MDPPKPGLTTCAKATVVGRSFTRRPKDPAYIDSRELLSRPSRVGWIVGVLLLVAAGGVPTPRLPIGVPGAAAAVPPARSVRFSEVRPILAELAGMLPAGLASLTPAQLETAWPAWIEQHDRDIRARIARGDEDTLVNWMLFGTSFTSRPRAVLGAVESGAGGDPEVVLRRTIELISGRIDDLLKALAIPGTDERRLFARALLERNGIRVATAADREAAREYLRTAVVRVASEQEQIDQELGATSGGDSKAEFVRRSRLFRTRGLSLDTSLVSNHSVEQALAAMKARGVVEPGAVRRVAIVGPGLDFADKDVGVDIYPQQTLQPFAVLDTVERLGLAPPGVSEIVLLDISPRVIDHVTQARARAAKNVGYTLNLPLPRSTPWLPEVRSYWQAFGDRIGAPARVPVSKAVAEVADVRSVRARPSVVRRLSVRNVNIVTDRLDGEAFDLVIATNVFIYYDVLEQALALANVEAMLKPGAFLLANVAVPNLTSVTIRPLDTTQTRYTRARDAGEDILDFIVWYQARAK
jgi:DNA-binding GntR family transcriptional regulator